MLTLARRESDCQAGHIRGSPPPLRRDSHASPGGLTRGRPHGNNGFTVVLPEQPVPALSIQVTEQLVDRIRDGGYAEGDRLPAERELARQFGVSRIVVREALRKLSEQGLVEIRPGVGTFVTSLDTTVTVRLLSRYIRQSRLDPVHLFEVRRLLEPAMAAQAAQRADAPAIEAMRANLQRSQKAVERLGDESEQAEAFAWADLEFHELMAEATGNPLYVVLLYPLLDNLIGLRRSGLLIQGTARQALEDHHRIHERIAAGDSTGAHSAMLDHLTAVEAWVEMSRQETADVEEEDTDEQA